ncbi:MAG: hypothetical protein GXY44_01710 [Phycisphaerales bacterium]|nr:hypothetical protein [Phycisphaerales bacterium]
MTAYGKPGISVGRMYVLPVVVAGLLLAAGYWPTRIIADTDGIRSMVAAQVLVVFTVYLTMVPALRRMTRNDASARFQLVLRAAVVRFLVTLVSTGLILWWGVVDAKVFLIWLAISYLIMLMVETLILVCRIKQLSVLPQTLKSNRFHHAGNTPRVSGYTTAGPARDVGSIPSPLRRDDPAGFGTGSQSNQP